MKFDPTFDYGTTDLENDDNLVLWKFGELVKNLYTLSSDADKQREIIGIGAAADEMAEDFYRYFTLSYNNYIEYGLLNDTLVEKLNQIDAFLDERSGVESDFWDDRKLNVNKDWAVLREKVQEIIRLLRMDGLMLEYDRKTEKGQHGGITETTKVRLVKKI